MADNSRHCKVWCVTITSAILFFSARGDLPLLVLTALIPVFLMGGLDAYYLAHERGFRAANQGFVSKLHRRRLYRSNLYVWSGGNIALRRWASSFGSYSVGLFYSTLAVTAAVVYLVKTFG